jgi:hypothetical protein
MMGVLVDSNVLIDIIADDPAWSEWSSNTLEEVIDQGCAVLNPIVYAEVSARYESMEDLNAVLAAIGLTREGIPFEAAFLAGKAFAAYRRRGGRKLAPLADFFIGAHAAVWGYALLTRDARWYRRQFPSVRLITPT